MNSFITNTVNIPPIYTKTGISEIKHSRGFPNDSNISKSIRKLLQFKKLNIPYSNLFLNMPIEINGRFFACISWYDKLNIVGYMGYNVFCYEAKCKKPNVSMYYNDFYMQIPSPDDISYICNFLLSKYGSVENAKYVTGIPSDVSFFTTAIPPGPGRYVQSIYSTSLGSGYNNSVSYLSFIGVLVEIIPL